MIIAKNKVLNKVSIIKEDYNKLDYNKTLAILEGSTILYINLYYIANFVNFLNLT